MDYEKTMRVGASPDDVFAALTTVPGLESWWTSVRGSGGTRGELAFTFGPPDPCVMRVDEATPASVRWTVTACAFLPEWVGTRPVFTITPVDGGGSDVHFRHHGLTPELDCIDQCTLGWNHALASLCRYVETGDGMPNGSPEDRARRAREATA